MGLMNLPPQRRSAKKRIPRYARNDKAEGDGGGAFCTVDACGRLALMMKTKLILGVVVCCVVAVAALGVAETQRAGGASPAPTAQGNDWTAPFPPHRVVGNVYYVGSKGLASYLITTPEGHILINSSMEASVPLIQESVEKLGFKFSDIKILLISHAHGDHCAGSARVKELTGAKYMVMDGDVPVVESGGKA